MKSYLFCFIILIGTSAFSQSKKELQAEVSSLKNQLYQFKNPNIELSDKHKKASYGLGVLVAGNLKSQGGDSLDIDVINAAMKDVFQGKTLKVEPQECTVIVQQYMQAAAEKRTLKAKEEGLKFLAENKTKEGVKVTASGLQYKVITAGAAIGKVPVADGSVVVHYTGKLVDGTVFDSSVERGEPATFKANEVISGWTEALQLMHEGDKWILYIPSELGWGDQGAGEQIPPNSVVIFEVELIKVN